MLLYDLELKLVKEFDLSSVNRIAIIVSANFDKDLKWLYLTIFEFPYHLVYIIENFDFENKKLTVY